MDECKPLACGSVALATIGLVAGDGNPDLAAGAFFMQLVIVLGLIGRALNPKP